ncbi:MAG TPA: hypothetical protein VFS35_01835 [Terrimicrobiaceae bacterium]|nr:hypothetical protein [Terrimicrobiaceae bacterium]
MRILTENAVIVCKHELGRAGIVAGQGFVFVQNRKVLVENDPENRLIVGCPNIGATIKPCTFTLTALRGYSNLLRINNKRVCLDTVTGLTDGTPPGMVKYEVRDPGQALVTSTT